MNEEKKDDKAIEDFLKVPQSEFEGTFNQLYGAINALNNKLSDTLKVCLIKLEIMQADIDALKAPTVDETISISEIERIKEKLKNVGIEFQSSGKNLSMLCPFDQKAYDFFQEVDQRDNENE